MMDGSHFDALSRHVGHRLTRRGSLSALIGVLAAHLSGHEVEAAPVRGAVCQEFGKPCRATRRRPAVRCCGNATCRQGRCRCSPKQRRCGDRCIPRSACCRDKDCGGDTICRAGTCLCPPGLKACNGGCIPVDGCCGGCPAGERCGEGSCGCVPDPAACWPPGSPCPENTPESCMANCCSGSGHVPINGLPWTCDSPAPGRTCGPISPCAEQGVRQDCVCNRCCLRSGQSPASFGGATCADCCSGACLPDDDTICA